MYSPERMMVGCTAHCAFTGRVASWRKLNTSAVDNNSLRKETEGIMIRIINELTGALLTSFLQFLWLLFKQGQFSDIPYFFDIPMSPKV